MDESQIHTRATESLPSPAALERWGPFERLERVGRGSFGEVYRAFDPTLQRYVALKLLIPSALNRDAEVNALLREARAIARVRHPNVLPIYGVSSHDGRVGLWSDFVRGTTLSGLLTAQGPMGPREAALVCIDVCRAVGAVHAVGLLHRDIKASNVMREEGGRILLMDFGLTHERGIDEDPSGTPTYMSPELLGGQPASIASEIYAIGVLLFNLLTGQHPVEGSDFNALHAMHLSSTRRTVLDVRPDLPEELARVVDTATHVDPQKRYASTGQMIAALSEAVGMNTGPVPVPPAAAKPRGFRPWMVVPLAAAAVALGLAFPRVRASLMPANGAQPIASAQDDYRQAHDLLAHYYRPNAIETAIPMLETIVARDARFAPAFADLGRANLLQFISQRDTKYIEPARESSLRAVALAPDLASPHVTLGALYGRTSQNDLASHELDEALRLDKYNAQAYGALADLYDRQGRNDLVEPNLQKAVSLAPDDWSLVQQLGEYYLVAGKWAEAGEQYRRASELAPDNPRAHNNLGLAYRGLDRLDESAAALQKAIELEPTFLRVRNLGMVLAEAGKYPESIAMLQRAIDMQPTQYRAWGLLAGVYLNQHADAKTVRDTYLKAIDLSADLRKRTPRDSYLLADVGSYYAAVGMEARALPLLAQAAALSPDSPEVLYQVAIGYETLHHRDEALRFIAKARAAGYASGAIARNPQLAALRADSRYTASVGDAR